MNYFSLVFLILLFADLALQFYLNARQKSAVNSSYAQVPTAFSSQISLSEHQKAANYTKADLRLENWELIYGTIITLVFTLGGGLNFLSSLTNINNYPLTSQVIFILCFGLIGSILSLPFKYYDTFVIEEQFGFNKMTRRLFFIDMLKAGLLSVIIGVPLLYLVFMLINSLGKNWWLWVWLILIIFQLAILIIYPTFIAPLFNKFTPLSDLELKSKIEALLTKCGFKSQGVFVMDGSKRSSHGNAYFTGLGTSKRIVFYDTLLKQLTHDEIIAVLAHELGHFKHKHIIKQMFLSFGITLIGLYIFSLLIDQKWFYAGLGVTHINHATGLVLLFIIVEITSLPLAPLGSYLSRKNEFQADNFAKKYTDRNNLISGLVKLYRDNASTLTPDDIYAAFYYSHPPASIRIANLEKNA